MATVQAELANVKSGATSDPAKLSGAVTALKDNPDIKVLEEVYPDTYRAVVALINATATTQEELKQLSAKVDAQGATVVRSREDQFFSNLNGSVKDWETINKSPEFLLWLSERDKYSGLTRRELLLDGYQKLDAVRVAGFFEDFVASQEPDPVTPAPPATPTPAPAPAKSIVPPSVPNRRPIDPAFQAPEIITASEIDRFYKDLQRNRYVGREDEAAKLDMKYSLAVTQGRVDLSR